jgi:stage II sporulation protein AB (anti-sigma F factor)
LKTLNEIKCEVPGISENEAVIRGIAASFILQLDPTVSELSDVRTAVSEAVTNSVVHGYRNKSGNIKIILRILENREIYIRIRDNGCGIEDVEQAREPLYTSAPDEERSGLGFSVMESFMDKLTVKSEVGKGTVIIMRKKLR